MRITILLAALLLIATTVHANGEVMTIAQAVAQAQAYNPQILRCTSSLGLGDASNHSELYACGSPVFVHQL